ncbi:MAG TPA: methyltransferase domain-containing protein [Pirellulales bacterium]|nr:methyltransferase domain-containing protein [Pirellulales bacterium]
MRQLLQLGLVAFSMVWAALAAPGMLQAQAPAVEKQKISPPTHYKERMFAPTMSYHGANWLIRDNREQEEHCQTLLKALKLQAGQVVCDMGCGNGFYTLRMAKLVGKTGRVLAVDIQPEMLHLLDLRAKNARVSNIQPIQSTVVDPKLPDGEVDLILLVDVYHEFSYPEQMLAAMRKALKPTGRIALVEFRLEDPDVPIKLEHKMSKEQIMKEFSPNGLKLVDEFEELPWQHVMFFGRDDAEADDDAKAQNKSSSKRGSRDGKLKRKKTAN